MTIPNLYRKIKQILDDSNIALVNKGLNEVDSLSDIFDEIGEVNRLPYALSGDVITIDENDLEGIIILNEDFNFDVFPNLKKVTIPDSVTTIDDGAFRGCRSLRNIYLKPTTPPSLNGTDAIPDNTTIHVPVGSGNAYKSATNWSYHADRIVEDIIIE